MRRYALLGLYLASAFNRLSRLDDAFWKHWLASSVQHHCAVHLGRWVSSSVLRTTNAIQGFLSLEHKTSLCDVGSQLAQAESVDIEAFEVPVASDPGLRYLTYCLPTVFNPSCSIITLWIVCWGAARDELEKYAVHGNGHLPVFCYLSDSFATVLGILHPRPAPPHLVELDEKFLPVPAPQSPEPPMNPVFLNGSVLHIKLSWTDIRRPTRKRRAQAFHSGSKQKMERVHLSEGEPVALSLLYIIQKENLKRRSSTQTWKQVLSICQRMQWMPKLR